MLVTPLGAKVEKSETLLKNWAFFWRVLRQKYVSSPCGVAPRSSTNQKPPQGHSESRISNICIHKASPRECFSYVCQAGKILNLCCHGNPDNLKFDWKWTILHLFFVVVTPWKGTLSEVYILVMLHYIRLGLGKHHLEFDTSGTSEAQVIGLRVPTGQNHL